ncbi:MAG: C-GCAxxG-C-C family protein [Thermodesulfobacteriota bacterium]
MNRIEKTVDLFASGLNCSQAMLTVFGETYGLDAEVAKRLARPLGGGMGRMARTCGAVTAAVLVLGLAKDNDDEGQARNVSYASVRDLLTRFEALHGSTECRSLLGVDLSTEEGLKKAQEAKRVSKVCPLFVKDAAGILEELLAH